MGLIKNISFLLIILICGMSCSTAPDYPRDNPQDPESDYFEPVFYNFTAQIQENQNVHLTWIDQTHYEDGYVLMKKLGEQEYVSLDTLSPSVVGSYIDTSLEFDVPTQYLLKSFVIRADTLKIGIQDTFDLFFGRVENSTATVQHDTLMIQWQNNLKIDHRILIEVDGLVIDTLKANTEKYAYNLAENTSAISIDIIPAIVSYLGELKEIQRIEITKEY